VIFDITEGQRHDSVPALSLIERVSPKCLLADKAYDNNAIRHALKERGAQAVIACNRIRSSRIPLDKDLYRARSGVECAFNMLKQMRRFATRYEKTLRNYSAVVTLACIRMWMRI